MIYLVPTAILAFFSLVVLFSSKSDFQSPQAHYLKHPGEFAILASNVSSSFTVTTFWFLFIFSIKSWSVPSFIALQSGVLAAYLFYAFLLCRGIKHKTFLNLIFGDHPPVVVRRIFFGLALLSILVELALGRSFVEIILIKNDQPGWIATASIAILGALTILYTYSGGMYAVIMADAIFMFLCVAVLSTVFFMLDTIPQLSGLSADLRIYEFSRLELLDYIFYFSAGLYVFLMFLFHPDFWYRNLRLPFASRRRRLTTILFSAVFTSALLQIAYFIAVSSRTGLDNALLYNNLVNKHYDLNSVIKVVEPVFHSSLGPPLLVFFVLISTFTTVSSLIISSVAGYYETGWSEESERYQSLLLQSFKVTVVVTAVALTFDVVSGVFVGLLIASSQLTFTTAIVMGRAVHLPARFYIWEILISLILFIVLALLNWVAAWHLYYPFLAIISAICVPLLMWGWFWWRGEGNHGK